MGAPKYPAPRFDHITVEDGDATRAALGVPSDPLLIAGYANDNAGVDATLIVQAAINAAKGTPGWLSGTSMQRFLRRTLDLGGRIYKVSAPLDVSGCHGVHIKNGGFFVDPDHPFASGRAVFEGLGDELRGFELSVSIQCNHAANGVNLQRFDSCRLTDCFVYGWGKREFGVKLGPQDYSVSSVIRGGAIYGYVGSYADNPVASRSATSLIANVSDLNIYGTYIHGGVENVLVSSSTYLFGCHVWNGQPGAETTALPNNVNIRFQGPATAGMVGGQCDNGTIVFDGQLQNKIVTGVGFLSNQASLDYCILLRATAPAQALAESVISDNTMFGQYDRFIKVDQSAGSFTSIFRCIVKDNAQRTYRTGTGSQPTKICATKGTARFYIGVAAFTGNTIKLDMRRFLLLPGIADPGLIFGVPELLGGTIGQILSYTYDPTTGLATVTFSAPATSNSNLTVYFDQAAEYQSVTAVAAGTTTPAGGGVP